MLESTPESTEKTQKQLIACSLVKTCKVDQLGVIK